MFNMRQKGGPNQQWLSWLCTGIYHRYALMIVFFNFQGAMAPVAPEDIRPDRMPPGLHALSDEHRPDNTLPVDYHPRIHFHSVTASLKAVVVEAAVLKGANRVRVILAPVEVVELSLEGPVLGVRPPLVAQHRELQKSFGFNNQSLVSDAGSTSQSAAKEGPQLRF